MIFESNTPSRITAHEISSQDDSIPITTRLIDFLPTKFRAKLAKTEEILPGSPVFLKSEPKFVLNIRSLKEKYIAVAVQ